MLCQVLLTTHRPNHEIVNPSHESLEKSYCLGHEWFYPGRHVKQVAKQIIFLVLRPHVVVIHICVFKFIF